MPTQTDGLQRHSIATVMGRGPQLQSSKSVIIYLVDILTCLRIAVSIKTSYTACAIVLYVLVYTKTVDGIKARSDWLVKLQISFAIYLRATRGKKWRPHLSPLKLDKSNQVMSKSLLRRLKPHFS